MSLFQNTDFWGLVGSLLLVISPLCDQARRYQRTLDALKVEKMRNWGGVIARANQTKDIAATGFSPRDTLIMLGGALLLLVSFGLGLAGQGSCNGQFKQQCCCTIQ